MAINNQTKIDYFKEPLAGKTGYEAFRNNLTEILESHETEINNLETDKLEKNGYTGTAQDLKNGIDLKLDKGTYTGTAQDLKDDITDLKNQMKYYDTRALAITDEASISIGDYIETKGSISINDGLGGEYIVESTLTDTTGGWQIATGKYANRRIKNSKSYNAELTGNPTAPTQASGNNSTKIATTAFVNAMLGGNAVPEKVFSTNGYVKMANGLILQWGSATSTINGQTITFPVAFINSCLNIVCSQANTQGDALNSIALNITKTNFTLTRTTLSGTVYWIAIGY